MFENKIISYGQIRELSRTFDWRQLNWPACHTSVFKIVHIRVFVLLSFVYSLTQLKVWEMQRLLGFSTNNANGGLNT